MNDQSGERKESKCPLLSHIEPRLQNLIAQFRWTTRARVHCATNWLRSVARLRHRLHRHPCRTRCHECMEQSVPNRADRPSSRRCPTPLPLNHPKSKETWNLLILLLTILPLPSPLPLFSILALHMSILTLPCCCRRNPYKTISSWEIGRKIEQKW